MFNPEKGLTIYRQFSTGDRIDVFSINELDQIIQFTISNGNVPLANSVSKIHQGIERIGLGSFVYGQLDKDIVKAQATSQLAAIFVHSGVYEYNGLTRNMEFWIKNSDWQLLLMKEQNR